ncbi:MAG: dTDP-4-dehydrorhamnose 3,5-epimerase [Steroidobacteraceae bacterium]|nr:dTDP-4-dehydrorhamnose 3,5-epimerase [Steroidobacteraceae bacterium]MDW8258190.1 dTDP-4-dehydrorhamnose 3,5-epimerase [Gammaproteobacteria bacterium]
MRFVPCDIPGVFLLEQEPRHDERGHFARLWCERELADRGLCARVAQVNTQLSPQTATLRGLHYQCAPHAEVKIVRCNRGSIFDVAVDLRTDSPTYRRWFGLRLSAGDGRMLYVPQGCAHGYLTLEPDTEVMYFTSEFYAPSSASGVRYDDPAFSIRWPLPPLLISAADRAWPLLEETSS